MTLVLEFLTATSLLGGTFFILIAAIGLLRLPDVLCRSHAVAKAMTLGIILMFVGLYLHISQGESETGLKILLAILFQLLTIPVSSHLLCQLAWEKGLPRWREKPVDEDPESKAE